MRFRRFLVPTDYEDPAPQQRVSFADSNTNDGHRRCHHFYFIPKSWMQLFLGLNIGEHQKLVGAFIHVFVLNLIFPYEEDLLSNHRKRSLSIELAYVSRAP